MFQTRTSRAVVAVAAAVLFFWPAGRVAAQGGELREVVTRHPGGSIHETWSVDAEGRRQGAYQKQRPDGSVQVRASYEDDRLDGSWEEFDRAGNPLLRAQYRRGELYGSLRRTAPDGTTLLVERYSNGELHGRREAFWPDGSLRERSTWRGGVLDGPFEEVARDGVRTRTGKYDDGRIDGTVKVLEGRRTVSKQVWQDGEPKVLDGLRVLPLDQAELRATLRSVLGLGEESVDTDGPAGVDDPLWPRRMATLRILQAYRALCRVPYEGMALEPSWNALCDAAAEICRRNGAIDHHPPRPPGVDDDLYQRGALGARRSNLHRGGPMETSVRGYMDDSDPSNIARVGHRRWCLNPAMGRTGFGEADGFTAMWSMDSSGGSARGLDEVLYPPAGWVPVDFFGPRYAWSIAPLKGGMPDADEIEISIRALDEQWVPTGEPLALDHVGVAPGGFGTGKCLIFRPEGLRVEPGAKYLCEVFEEGERRPRFAYVVAFCDPVRAPDEMPRRR